MDLLGYNCLGLRVGLVRIVLIALGRGLEVVLLGYL